MSPSTATLSEAPEAPREASDRSAPSTTANASSSSGRLRPSAAACARASRARSSKATRSDGGQERAAHEERRDTDCGEPRAGRGPPRPPRKRGADDQKRAGEIVREVGNEQSKRRARQ